MSQLWSEIKDISTDRKSVRSFGLLIGTICFLLALLIVWRNHWSPSPAFGLLVIAGIHLVVGALIATRILAPFYKVWMGFALVLGFLMSHLILTLVFYGVITPIGLFFRLRGRDPLRRKLEPESSTYWIPKAYRDESEKRLEKYY